MPVGPYHFLLLSMSLVGSMDERFSCALFCLTCIHARFDPLEFFLYHGIANGLEGRKLGTGTITLSIRALCL